MGGLHYIDGREENVEREITDGRGITGGHAEQDKITGRQSSGGCEVMVLSTGRSLRAGFLAAVFALVFLFVSGPAAPGEVRAANPHDWHDKGQCATCHESAMPALKFDSVTVCTHCHDGYIENHPVTKHPIGKRPGINISRRMPLDSGGKLVCYTCHDMHNRSDYPNMLRIDYLRLCSACHRGY
ncbi:MAG: cytochrome c3 family protein [Thermodesulfobacteriota bacterium]